MTEPTHYHQRIQRATERLAHLQARELLADQRRKNKAKLETERDERNRRKRMVEIIFLSGAQALDDCELLGALMMHVERRQELEIQTEARSLGESRIQRSH